MLGTPERGIGENEEKGRKSGINEQKVGIELLRSIPLKLLNNELIRPDGRSPTQSVGPTSSQQDPTVSPRPSAPTAQQAQAAALSLRPDGRTPTSRSEPVPTATVQAHVQLSYPFDLGH